MRGARYWKIARQPSRARRTEAHDGEDVLEQDDAATRLSQSPLMLARGKGSEGGGGCRVRVWGGV